MVKNKVKTKYQELHRISSTAIIYKKQNKEFKYLITQRSPQKKAFPNKWTVPGGGLEVADYINDKPTTEAGQWYSALEKSLRREIKEEVNLSVSKLKYLLDIAFIRPDGVPVLILSYYGKYASGKVKLDQGSVDFAWASFQEAKKYDLIEGILEEIGMVDNLLKK